MGLLHFPSSSTLAVGAGFAALLAADSSPSGSQFAVAPILKKALALLLVLNWRSLPFAWHIQVWKTVPELYARIWRKGEERAMAIARDPFEVSSVTKGRVTLGDGDYNMHMSNSTYARVSDAARFRFLLELIGPAFGAGVWSPLAATAFTFYREVPLGAKYEIETRVLSWDDKWMYCISRFTTAPKRGSSERTLCCVALFRSCFKLRGSRLSIPPARVLSYSGLAGAAGDRANWERTQRLKRAGPRTMRRWLEYGGAAAAKRQGKWEGELPSVPEGWAPEEWQSDGLDGVEERRLDKLVVAKRYGDTEQWKDL
ncbi:hypothetical protein JCM3770_005381 [Rhodotorula araucariae]